jgi:hypothetical protein
MEKRQRYCGADAGTKGLEGAYRYGVHEHGGPLDNR